MSSTGQPAERLVVLSAGGATTELNDPLLFRYAVKPILWHAFRYLYDDMLRMERLLEVSDLDWTILRLSYLKNEPLTGEYRIAYDASVSYGRAINRADVAHYIVNQLIVDAQAHRRHINIAH